MPPKYVGPPVYTTMPTSKDNAFLHMGEMFFESYIIDASVKTERRR
jgi:hypothetical protein